MSSAADVDEDYSRAAPKDLAQKAATRAALLRKTPGGAKVKKAAVKTPEVDDEVAPDGGGTMVMPADDAPVKKAAPKKGAKPAAKSAVKGRRGDGTVPEPNLPGMPAAEDIH